MYKRLNLLASFAYLRDDPFYVDLLLALAPFANILIDSGAHTNYQLRLAAAAGKPTRAREVLLQDYVDFCLKIDGKVWQYIALDVIRNKAATDKNLDAMLVAGLRPMPVYIEGHDASDLARILAVNPRICVAGAVAASDTYIRRRYAEILNLSGGVAKIHGLGYGRFPGTFKAAFASCDSSSFNYGSRYGVIYLYNRQTGFMAFPWHAMADNRPDDPIRRSKYIDALSDMFDLSAEQLSNPLLYKGKDAQISLPLLAGSVAYLDFMQHVREWGKDYFIAAPTAGFIFTLIALVAAQGTEGGYRYETVKGFYQKIDGARKQSNADCISLCAHILEEATLWQPMPHSL